MSFRRRVVQKRIGLHAAWRIKCGCGTRIPAARHYHRSARQSEADGAIIGADDSHR